MKNDLLVGVFVEFKLDYIPDILFDGQLQFATIGFVTSQNSSQELGVAFNGRFNTLEKLWKMSEKLNQVYSEFLKTRRFQESAGFCASELPKPMEFTCTYVFVLHIKDSGQPHQNLPLFPASCSLSDLQLSNFRYVSYFQYFIFKRNHWPNIRTT